MKKTKIKEYKADLLLLTVAIAWGVTFLMVQDAIKSTPVYSFLFYRFALSTILMFFISYNHLNKINTKNIFFGLILGSVLFFAFASQTFALNHTKSSIVAFITGLNVIIVPFLAYFLFKQQLRKNVFIASIISAIGLYLLTMSGHLNFEKGELLTLICAFLFALHIILTGIFSKKVNVYLLVLFQLFTVSTLSLCFSLYLEPNTFIIEYNSTFIKALIVTSVFATVYAFLIQTYMQQYTSATKTAIIFTMEPLSAAIYGYFIGNEVLSHMQILGAFLIVSATLIAELKNKK